MIWLQELSNRHTSCRNGSKTDANNTIHITPHKSSLASTSGTLMQYTHRLLGKSYMKSNAPWHFNAQMLLITEPFVDSWPSSLSLLHLVWELPLSLLQHPDVQWFPGQELVASLPGLAMQPLSLQAAHGFCVLYSTMNSQFMQHSILMHTHALSSQVEAQNWSLHESEVPFCCNNIKAKCVFYET